MDKLDIRRVSPIFHPIILPKKDKMDEEADKEKDEPSAATGAAPAATGAAAAAPASSNADPLAKNTEDKVSLMELTAHVHTGVKNCRDKEIAAGNVGDQKKGACSLGYNKAYELYNQGLAFTKFNHILFEQERVVLGTFRDRLKGMIARKEMRLKNMKEQLKKLEEAIANADKAVTVGSLLEGLKEHKTIIDKSCKDMQARTVIAQKELNDIYVALDKIKPLTMKDLTAVDDTKVGENKAEEKKADATPSSQTSSGDKLADNKADATASGATGSDSTPEQSSQGTTVQ